MTVSSQLEWEEPSESRHRYDWYAIAAQLERHPMEWAKVFDNGPTSTANALRQNSVKALRSTSGFEIQTRNNRREPDRTCTLYLRYNPNKDERLND